MPLGIPGMPSWNSLQAGMAARLAPSLSEMAVGAETLKYGKATVKIKTYEVDLFDMSFPNDRKRFAELMMKLAPLIPARQAVIWVNKLQTLVESGGATKLVRYVEWSEYEVPGDRISDDELQVGNGDKDGKDGDKGKAGDAATDTDIVAPMVDFDVEKDDAAQDGDLGEPIEEDKQ